MREKKSSVGWLSHEKIALLSKVFEMRYKTIWTPREASIQAIHAPKRYSISVPMVLYFGTTSTLYQYRWYSISVLLVLYFFQKKVLLFIDNKYLNYYNISTEKLSTVFFRKIQKVLKLLAV